MSKNILTPEQLEQFNEWTADGNASKIDDNLWLEQTTQWSKQFTTDELKEFFKREYLSESNDSSSDLVFVDKKYNITYEVLKSKENPDRWEVVESSPTWKQNHSIIFVSKSDALNYAKVQAGIIIEEDPEEFFMNNVDSFSDGGVVKTNYRGYNLETSIQPTGATTTIASMNGTYQFGTFATGEETQTSVEKMHDKIRKKNKPKYNYGGSVDMPPRSERHNKTYYHLTYDDGHDMGSMFFDNKKEAELKFDEEVKNGIQFIELSQDSFNENGWLNNKNMYLVHPQFKNGGTTSKRYRVTNKKTGAIHFENANSPNEAILMVIKKVEIIYPNITPNDFVASITEQYKDGGKITVKKNTNNPNFLTINIEYEIMKGSPTALGKQTMSGQMRELSSSEAYKKALEIAKQIEQKYNIEDIEVTDLNNGTVQIFAVSDDFIKLPISELQKFKNGGGVDNSMDYRMLGRLQQDNDYFLGNGNRSEKSLWSGNVDDQISEMKKIYKRLSVKPEWLSMEDILDYERKMKSNSEDKFNNGGSIKEQNYDMIKSDNKQIMHHSKELDNVLKTNKTIPAWALALVNQSSENLSNVTHYLDGAKKFATGGVSQAPTMSNATFIDFYGNEQIGMVQDMDDNGAELFYEQNFIKVPIHKIVKFN